MTLDILAPVGGLAGTSGSGDGLLLREKGGRRQVMSQDGDAGGELRVGGRGGVPLELGTSRRTRATETGRGHCWTCSWCEFRNTFKDGVAQEALAQESNPLRNSVSR
jgi:hypothetical protein